jgi:ribonuclease HI
VLSVCGNEPGSVLSVANIITVKAFQSLHEAQAFMEGRSLATSNTSGEQKFYAVQNGRVPGVYTDWTQAQAQIRGIKKPRHKKFNTRAEAEAFVAAGKGGNGVDPADHVTPEEEIRRLIVRNSAPGLQTNGTYAPTDKDGNPYEIGRRPLPPGAEDGYDPNVKLTSDGTIVDRTEEEKTKTKTVAKLQDPPGMLRIFTDGSSLSNGQAGARAGVGVYFGPQDPKYANSPSSKPKSKSKLKSIRYVGSKKLQPLYTMDWAARQRGSDDGSHKDRENGEEDDETEEEKEKLTNWRYRNVSEALKGSKQTNQRAELTAILRALDIAPRHREVTIYTDSKYSIDCVTNWYRNWEKNGWVNSKGKPVENKDLVADIRERIVEREQLGKVTYFVWVKGHAQNEGNIAADRLAVEGARGARDLEDGDDEKADARRVKEATNGEDAENDDEDREDEETRRAFQAMERAMEDDSDDEDK